MEGIDRLLFDSILLFGLESRSFFVASGFVTTRCWMMAGYGGCTWWHRLARQAKSECRESVCLCIVRSVDTPRLSSVMIA